MTEALLIVGQGLAGSLLGRACERAGIDFEIVDRGHATAASRIGAGIINPITGRRIVKSWRIDTLLPVARETYAALERELGVRLLRPMRVRRLFHDEGERRVFAEKSARGELAPHAGAADAAGFWIEGAWQVDTAALIAALRTRWRAAGRLREGGFSAAEARGRRVVYCTGAFVPAGAGPWPLRVAAGEVLRIAGVAGLDPGVILNQRQWLLPGANGEARVGATYRVEATPTDPVAAKAFLGEAASRLLAGRAFEVTGIESGLRAATADRRPLIGWLGADRRTGVFTGLGSKGALLAPWGAGQWVEHLKSGKPFDPEVSPDRTMPGGG